jgi:hypothetical protein
MSSAAEIKANKTAGGNNAFHNFNNDFAHITDVNERRRLALAEIDKAPFGWYHVRACVVAGVGFFTDSYDIFAVSLLTTMLGIVYWPQNKGVMPTNADTGIKVATSGGTVLGQLGFGALADIVGRKKVCLVFYSVIARLRPKPCEDLRRRIRRSLPTLDNINIWCLILKMCF